MQQIFTFGELHMDSIFQFYADPMNPLKKGDSIHLWHEKEFKFKGLGNPIVYGIGRVIQIPSKSDGLYGAVVTNNYRGKIR